MVYLDTIIRRTREEILSEDNIQKYCYLYVSDKQSLKSYSFDLTGEEETVAAKGYKSEKVDPKEIQTIINRKPIKGLNYTQNIYKLLGIHLADPENKSILESIDKKFNTFSIKYKYLICKLVPEYDERFRKELVSGNRESVYTDIICYIIGESNEFDYGRQLGKLFLSDLDVIDLLLLQDLQTKLIDDSIEKVNYIDKTAKVLVRDVLANFGNAIKKITQDRRKDHESFEINDEYDVQDLLYVILKPIFPKLITEDPSLKVGAKYTKIDLILREEGILIEVKMIKTTDSDEKPFVEDLKKDIQSYYIYPYLKDLFIFVFDPYNKTKDVQNFLDLEGRQEIKEIKFDISVIVNS